MGLTLVVYPAGRFNELRRFPLDGEKVTVGADPNALVPMDPAAVRGAHARLSCRGGEWFIEGDQECSVGEVPLVEESTRVVRAGDPIRVGDVLMEIRAGGPDDFADDSQSQNSLRPPPFPTIRVTEGASVGHVLALREEGRVYTIGRGKECDLTLDDRNVSREHVEVVRKPEGIMLMDRTSTRGTWLGASRLVPQRRAKWDNRRMVKLGVTVLVVDDPMERVAEFTLRAPKEQPVSVGRLSQSALSYEDEGRDAMAITSGIIVLPGAIAPGSVAQPITTRSRRPPPPSAAKTALKILAIIVLFLVVSAIIGLVALLAR